MATMNRTCVSKDCDLWFIIVLIEESCLKVGSHDPFYDPMIFLALFQLKEMLICIINFFQIEK